MHSLHPRVRVQWMLTALLAASILGFLVLVFGSLQSTLSVPEYMPFVVAAVIAVLGTLHTFARYGRWRYEVQDDALFLQRGVLTLVETAVPFVRVQHVDTQRGPIARLLGLSSVVVYTAGSRGADVTVPGLTPERADSLRNRLRELAVESEPDDGV